MVDEIRKVFRKLNFGKTYFHITFRILNIFTDYYEISVTFNSFIKKKGKRF